LGRSFAVICTSRNTAMSNIARGCDIISAVTLDGTEVSSTAIRAMLERGEKEEAARYLGHDLLNM